VFVRRHRVEDRRSWGGLHHEYRRASTSGMNADDAGARSSCGAMSSGLDTLGLGFCPTWFNGDLHCTFHWVFERHFDSQQSVLIDSFGSVRFYRPT
jgi:hypothetical protein